MVYIVMGVSGCGKTTIGKMLAEEKNLPFFDADDFHPEENVEKMRNVIPLNDEDRKPWLLNLSQKISEWNRSGGAVLACSALKESYRKLLISKSGQNQVQFIYLQGSKGLISERMKIRTGHYMPAELLDSQFKDLEEPKNALTVSINSDPESISNEILNNLSENDE
ncbi:MAG: gluconokinase [Balneolaceae bacterium]|nr:MAG: gluconokinase [Balneolaceae bacterium]